MHTATCRRGARRAPRPNPGPLAALGGRALERFADPAALHAHALARLEALLREARRAVLALEPDAALPAALGALAHDEAAFDFIKTVLLRTEQEGDEGAPPAFLKRRRATARVAIRRRPGAMRPDERFTHVVTSLAVELDRGEDEAREAAVDVRRRLAARGAMAAAQRALPRWRAAIGGALDRLHSELLAGRRAPDALADDARRALYTLLVELAPFGG